MMASFAEKLAASEKVERPSKDVTVALRAEVAEKRAELAERREELQQRFAEAQADALRDQRLTQSAPELPGFAEEFVALAEAERELDREEADCLITLRFWEMPGEEWAELTVKHPARPGVLVDMPYGYNMHAAAKEAAEVNGKIVDGDKLMDVSEEEWARLWKQLPGRSFGAVADAIYFLNEYEPEQRVERLKKVSRTVPSPVSE